MPDQPEVTDLTAVPDRWSAQSEDLRTSLIVLAAGQSLAEHVNEEADLVLVGLSGRGRVTVDDISHALTPWSLVHIPKGARRRLTAGDGGDHEGAADVGEPLRVLVVHRRTAVSGAWRWRPRRRRPWEDPWEEIEAAAVEPGDPGRPASR